MIQPDQCEPNSFRRKKAGKGISLVLCKQAGTMKAESYRFDPTQYTPEEAKAWLDKANLKYLDFEPAVNKVEASNPDGKVWGSGLHHVWVNDKPARVWVPEDTVLETFSQMKSHIAKEGSIGLGIDHLDDTILDDNEILRKLNLLDVGEVSEIVTDGDGIYIQDSTLHNDLIASLHDSNQLPAYSVVGSMDARPCPTNKADYVLKSLDVERVDFVEEGGCQSCKVGAQPEGLILTAKLSIEANKGDEIMDAVDETNPITEETPKVEESVEKEPVEAPTEEVEVAETEEQKEVDDVKVDEEVPEEDVVEVVDEPSTEEILKELRKEIEDLKKDNKELGSKKAPVEATNAEEEVKELIKAGRALPKQKEWLIEMATETPEIFQKMKATMPKMVTLETKAKLAKKEDKAKPKPKTWEEEYGELAKHFRI
jgi:hypothetical protein